MQLHPIDQRQDPASLLPRVNPEFIGLGHQLESYRKQRKQVQQEHKSIQNRVILLEKQQIKAQKDLLKKRRRLEQIISVKERQEMHDEQKNKVRRERMEELERLKKQNEYIRLIHRHNLESTVAQLKDKNHSDYSRARQQRIDGEYRKKALRNTDLQQKKDNWFTINITKQKGKQRVDQFYKKKNKEHIKQYESRIKLQNQERQSRIRSIKDLEMREKTLREKLEFTTMRNSRMEELIKSASRTLSPMNITSLEQELYGTARPRKEKKKTQSGEKPYSRKNSGAESHHARSFSLNDQHHKDEYIEQNIELADEENKKSGIKIVHRRRKNKHANRYKQYEAY